MNRRRRLATSAKHYIVDVSSNYLSPEVTFSRASSATYFDSTGTLQTASTNIPRFGSLDITGLNPGLIIEGSRTNSIKNSTMVGASVGVPGVRPTGYRFFNSDPGIAFNVVGKSTVNGLEYIDVQAVGTTTLSGALFFQFTSANDIAATSGQTWTASTYMALIAGSETNFSAVRHVIEEQTALGVAVVATNINEKSNLTSSLQRRTVTRTLSDGTTVSVSSHFALVWTSAGLAIDATYRIAAPQLELGLFPSSFIPTTTVAATRATDACHITSLLAKSWFNSSEGTIAAVVRSAYAHISFERAFQIGDAGGIANRITAWAQSTTTFIRVNIQDNSAEQIAIEPGNTVWAANTDLKIAIGYKINDSASAINNSTVVTDTVCTIPSASLTIFSIGMTGSGDNQLYGVIKTLAYFFKRQPDGTIRALPI